MYDSSSSSSSDSYSSDSNTDDYAINTTPSGYNINNNSRVPTTQNINFLFPEEKEVLTVKGRKRTYSGNVSPSVLKVQNTRNLHRLLDKYHVEIETVRSK